MRVGDVFADRFVIQELTGSGGMGSIYRALDQQSGQHVALKTIHAAELAERFLHEAKVLAELDHPAIVRYVAHGEARTGELYLAMEWLEGEDLAKRLRQRELTLEESLTLVERVAAALAAAHARNIVHRDLKPANLLLVGGEVARVKLLDFGIARLDSASAGMTRTGFILGTPGYMAPEQAMGRKPVGPAADVFALGCLLYRCLSGRAPFPGTDFIAVLAKLVFEEPPRLREVRPDLSSVLDELVGHLMAKAPEGRPANGDAVVSAVAATRTKLADAEVAGELGSSAVETVHLSSKPRSEGGPTIARAAITGDEQRIVSVVVTEASPDEGPLLTSAGGEGWSRLLDAVRPFGAEVVLLANGSLVATLSASGEPTDRAAQAARCALSMRAELPAREMVLATGRTREGRLPVGEVIDRATAVLRSAEKTRAAHGGAARVRLDEVTAGLLESQFEVGGDQLSLFLWSEREPFGIAARTLLGRPTSCVGRDGELGLLDDTFSGCVAQRSTRAVVVTAPAGTGKSRLRHEFLRRLAARGDRVDVWMARGDPIGQGSPFRLLGAAIRCGIGVLDGESSEVRQQKLRARVGRHFRGDDLVRVTEFIGEMCGITFPDTGSPKLRAARHDPVRMGDQMRRAWEDFVGAECAECPVLFVLEDLQWGDLPTVQWIDAALRHRGGHPFMVLALGRPELRDVFPNLWSDRWVIDLALPELPAWAGEALVLEALGDRASPGLAPVLAARAAGNAFYLEEMIRAVAEGRGDRLPDTVLAMVQARLDRLEPDARRMLRAASVFGQIFWEGGVATLIGKSEHAPAVARWLDELTRREIITRRNVERFPGEREYIFRNALVRDSAYAMLTEEDRTLGHRLAAEWLDHAGESDVALLAAHLEKGGEVARAAGLYQLAAEQALAANDFTAALDRARRGLSSGARANASSETLGALALIQAGARKWLGDNVEAEAHAADAMRLLPRAGRHWLVAAAELATVSAKMGNHATLLAVAQELRSVTPGLDPQPYVVASARVAIQLLHAGHLDAADGLLLAVEAVFPRASADPEAAACVYQARAIRAMFRGDVGGFLGYMLVAAESFEQAGDLRSAGTQRANVAYAYIELGAYEAAEQALRLVVTTAERMELRDLAAGARHNLGIALARRGALEEARVVESAAVRASVAQRNRRLESGCRTYFATILLLSQDLTGAEREARAAVDILAVAPPMRAHALGTLGRVLVAQGRPAEALAATEEAMNLMTSVSGLEEGESLVHLAHVEALFATGGTAAGQVALRSAHEQLQRRAARISDPGWRESFLSRVPDNARILDLARMWLGMS